MSVHAPAFEDPLQAAANELRELCRDAAALPPWFDAGSVGRILVHIDNIKRSVIASTRDHVNAARRLNDFALVFARFARKAEPPDGPLAARMTSVSENLRAASKELSRTQDSPAVTTDADPVSA